MQSTVTQAQEQDLTADEEQFLIEALEVFRGLNAEQRQNLLSKLAINPAH